MAMLRLAFQAGLLAKFFLIFKGNRLEKVVVQPTALHTRIQLVYTFSTIAFLYNIILLTSEGNKRNRNIKEHTFQHNPLCRSQNNNGKFRELIKYNHS
jgi:hypothetical protein